MLFVGVDWGERHHDLCLLDQDGPVLATRQVAEGLTGVGELHALVAAHAQDPGQVAVGIETDRGLLVNALLTAGYQIYAVNPQAVSRYRGRHRAARAKSDRGDAKVLADLVRTDRHNHRQVAGDSPLVEAVKVHARAHQSLIWSRQRHVNALRSALREVYPGALAALGAQLCRARGSGRAGAGANAGAGAPADPGSGAAGAGRGSLPPGRGRPGGLAPLSQPADHRLGAACWPVQRPPGRRHHLQPARAWRGAGAAECSGSSATTRAATRRPRAARPSPAPPRSPGPRGFAPWWSPGRPVTSGWWMPATCGRSPP